MRRNIHTLLFYKFIEIKDPEKFSKEHLELCNELGLLGRVLVGREGINGSVTGTKKKIDKYKSEIRKDSRFSDIVFKEDSVTSRAFTKMRVLVKDEIIAIKKKIDLSKKAPYISASELKKMYDSGEDFIILDTRNDYEWKVGKFKNARVMPIKTFREFPEMIEKMKKDLKGKKIVTYCTGGIRCEKASAYMKQNGFENEEVYQLKDGIINFCKEYPDTCWEGKCFVFDKRLIEDYNTKDNDVTSCELCGGACDLYRNCKNNECDSLVVMCVDCEKVMNGCCSESCLGEFREHCMAKSRLRQGRRTKIDI